MDSLSLIKRPIISEINRFRDDFVRSLAHANPLLDSALKVVSSRTGKIMRPILVFLSAKLFGDINDITNYSALTFEFFHTASLLHDDVVDESDQRRGELSINKAFNNQIAILVGDYILSIALLNASKTSSHEIIRSVSTAASRLAEGELQQLDNVPSINFSEDVYFNIISNKTAALFASCAESGARSVGASKEDIEVMRQFGETLGICFQIRDDIFDYDHAANIGKPTGNDMKEGKLTLPVLYVLNKTNDQNMKSVAIKIKKGEVTESEISDIVRFTIDNGGIDYARKVMFDYADKAKSLLNRYPDSEVKSSLLAYADYVVGRNI